MTKQIKLSVLFIALLSTSSCIGIYEDAVELAESYRPLVKEISVDELKAKTDSAANFLLIDVRQPSDYYTENIPGSVLLQRGVLEFKIADADFWMAQYMYPPEKDAEIIVYCSAGNNSVLAAIQLLQLGYKNVISLKGGYKAYNPNQDLNAKPKAATGGCGG